MAEVTVSQFADVLKVPVDRLLVQLDQAGIKVDGPDARISDDAKLELLTHLRRSHGSGDDGDAAPRKITLKRKTQSELKLASVQGRARTVNVEVRQKKTYIKRDVLAEQARHQQDEIDAKRREAEEAVRREAERVENERRERERVESENLRRAEEEQAKKKAAEEARRVAEQHAREEAERREREREEQLQAQQAKPAGDAARKGAPAPAAAVAATGLSACSRRCTDPLRSSGTSRRWRRQLTLQEEAPDQIASDLVWSGRQACVRNAYCAGRPRSRYR